MHKLSFLKHSLYTSFSFLLFSSPLVLILQSNNQPFYLTTNNSGDSEKPIIFNTSNTSAIKYGDGTTQYLARLHKPDYSEVDFSENDTLYFRNANTSHNADDSNVYQIANSTNTEYASDNISILDFNNDTCLGVQEGGTIKPRWIKKVDGQNNAFSYVNTLQGIKKVEISDIYSGGQISKLTEIGYYSFSGDARIFGLSNPTSHTYWSPNPIGDTMFENLESFEVSDTNVALQVLHSGAFSNARKLKTADFGKVNKIAYIDEPGNASPFQVEDYKNDQTSTVPKPIVNDDPTNSPGDYSDDIGIFENDYKLTSLDLYQYYYGIKNTSDYEDFFNEDGTKRTYLKSIPSKMFKNCTNLNRFNSLKPNTYAIPASVRSIGENAFEETGTNNQQTLSLIFPENLDETHDGITSMGSHIFGATASNFPFNNIVLPDPNPTAEFLQGLSTSLGVLSSAKKSNLTIQVPFSWKLSTSTDLKDMLKISYKNSPYYKKMSSILSSAKWKFIPMTDLTISEGPEDLGQNPVGTDSSIINSANLAPTTTGSFDIQKEHPYLLEPFPKYSLPLVDNTTTNESYAKLQIKTFETNLQSNITFDSFPQPDPYNPTAGWTDTSNLISYASIKGVQSLPSYNTVYSIACTIPGGDTVRQYYLDEESSLYKIQQYEVNVWQLGNNKTITTTYSISSDSNIYHPANTNYYYFRVSDVTSLTDTKKLYEITLDPDWQSEKYAPGNEDKHSVLDISVKLNNQSIASDWLVCSEGTYNENDGTTKFNVSLNPTQLNENTTCGKYTINFGAHLENFEEVTWSSSTVHTIDLWDYSDNEILDKKINDDYLGLPNTKTTFSNNFENGLKYKNNFIPKTDNNTELCSVKFSIVGNSTYTPIYFYDFNGVSKNLPGDINNMITIDNVGDRSGTTVIPGMVRFNFTKNTDAYVGIYSLQIKTEIIYTTVDSTGAYVYDQPIADSQRYTAHEHSKPEDEPTTTAYGFLISVIGGGSAPTDAQEQLSKKTFPTENKLFIEDAVYSKPIFTINTTIAIPGHTDDTYHWGLQRSDGNPIIAESSPLTISNPNGNLVDVSINNTFMKKQSPDYSIIGIKLVLYVNMQISGGSLTEYVLSSTSEFDIYKRTIPENKSFGLTYIDSDENEIENGQIFEWDNSANELVFTVDKFVAYYLNNKGLPVEFLDFRDTPYFSPDHLQIGLDISKDGKMLYDTFEGKDELPSFITFKIDQDLTIDNPVTGEPELNPEFGKVTCWVDTDADEFSEYTGIYTITVLLRFVDNEPDTPITRYTDFNFFLDLQVPPVSNTTTIVIVAAVGGGSVLAIGVGSKIFLNKLKARKALREEQLEEKKWRDKKNAGKKPEDNVPEERESDSSRGGTGF